MWVTFSVYCMVTEAKQYLLPAVFNMVDVSYSNYKYKCLHTESLKAAIPTAVFQPSLIFSSCDPNSPCIFEAGRTEDADGNNQMLSAVLYRSNVRKSCQKH